MSSSATVGYQQLQPARTTDETGEEQRRSNLFRVIVWTVATLVARSAFYILSPLSLGALDNNSNSTGHNTSNAGVTASYPDDCNNTDPHCHHKNKATEQTSFLFLCIFEWLVSWFLSALWLAFVLIFRRRTIGNAECNLYVVKLCGTNGFFMAMCVGLWNLSASSNKIAPYLLGILGNLMVPLQIVIRYVILRKKPTVIKFLCAVVIILTEFVCLLPTFVPGFESKSAKKDDGGASGIAGFLWPLCFAVSLIPSCLSNAFVEKGMKEKIIYKTEVVHLDSEGRAITETSVELPSVGLNPSNDDLLASLINPRSRANSEGVPTQGESVGSPVIRSESTIDSNHLESTEVRHLAIGEQRMYVIVKKREINMAFFLFLWCFFGLLSVLLFLAVDFIPHFGTSRSWHEFYDRFMFNLQCLIGGDKCPANVGGIYWMTFITTFCALLSVMGMTRYSEGSTFVVIILSLRTPIVFLFWSIFEETPHFHYKPHAHLSTVLAVGALFIMVPAVIMYEKGDDIYKKWAQRRFINNQILYTRDDSGEPPHDAGNDLPGVCSEAELPANEPK